MALDEFLKSYDKKTATAVESLAFAAIEEMKENFKKIERWNDSLRLDYNRVVRQLEEKSWEHAVFNTAGEYQSVVSLNMAVMQFMQSKEHAKNLVEAVQKERSGKREWWK